MTIKTVEGGIFTCPNCGQKSKLSRQPTKPGNYKITCYKCHHQTIYRMGTNSKEIPLEEPKPSEFIPEKNTQGHQGEHVPFVEIKKIALPEKKAKPDSTFLDYLPPFLRNRFLIYGNLLGILIFILIGIPIIGVYQESKEELPELLEELKKNKPTIILDQNGNLISEIFQKKTSSYRLSDYPNKLIEIVLAVEDKDFYEHSGIDFFALVRAMYKNITNLSYTQGASTITQQLARILIKDRRKSLKRKFREAMVALALESRLSKDKILEAYLNQVYLGHGAFGFQVGANYYFEKDPQDLGVMEMVLLASLASNPNKYSPFKNAQESKQRVQVILDLLAKRKIISPSYLDHLDSFFKNIKQPPYNTVFGSRYDSAPYVTEHIREFLKSIDPNVNIYDVGGYIVETTLLKDVHNWLPTLVKEHLDQLKKTQIVKKVKVKQNPKTPTEELELQAAVIGLEPKTGAVLFMHGGGEEFHAGNQFNRAIKMRRQTGSAIKPILYSAGIDSGIIFSSTRMMDAPLVFKNSKGKVIWSPDNFGQVYEGEISIRDALAKSKNTIAVQIGEQMGIPLLEKYFSKFFFVDPKEKQKRFRADLSITLGSLELSPLEMASAYSSFVNDGNIKKPYLIKKILDVKQRIIYERKTGDEFNLKVPEERRVIDPDTAEVMTSLMKGSANASGVKATGYTGEVIGKTGTTNDYIDAWFVGAKPRLSMAVWVGYDDSAYGMGNKAMGATVAAPLWGKIAKRLLKEGFTPEEKFEFSKRATWQPICRESGHLVGPECANIGSEIFKKDKKPPICKITHGYQEREFIKDLFP